MPCYRIPIFHEDIIPLEVYLYAKLYMVFRLLPYFLPPGEFLE